jgi:trehalose-phosphatase
MEYLDSTVDLARFWAAVAGAAKSLLMLDYDGTLSPFVVQRDRAVPYPGVREMLRKIIVSGRTRVVVVSGRSAGDLVPLLGLDPLPEIWGSHGGERMMPDGSHHLQPLGEDQLRGLRKADRVIEDMSLPQHFEIKPLGRAFHWRGLSEEAIRRAGQLVSGQWRPIAETCGLELRSFDGGMELRVPGVDKGRAVKRLQEEMDQGAPAAYLGDDLTDEDAFQALDQHGLSVMVRSAYRSTAAQLWLKPPEELTGFLQHWLDATGCGEENG